MVSTKLVAVLSSVFAARYVAGQSCPSIWSTIVSDLAEDFAGCTPLTAFAIRFAFHDAAGYSNRNPVYPPASGGADGSLLLSPTEVLRSPEAPLQGYQQYLLSKWNQYESTGISAADLVQMAGSVGVRSCPGGPVYKTVVGRNSTSRACPPGNISVGFGPNSTHAFLVQQWAEKGFNQRELVALVGAHSVSRAFAQEKYGIPPGGPQDTSPMVWDTTYFSETQAQVAPQGVFRFNSDIQLASKGQSAQAYTEFANSMSNWSAAFSAAMYKLSILGIPSAEVDTFTDCTSLVEAVQASSGAPSGAPQGYQGPPWGQYSGPQQSYPGAGQGGYGGGHFGGH